MRMCINKRVVIGLAAVAAGILLVAPHAFLAALPLLIVLVCPLSMMFMMRGMRGGRSCAAGNSETTSETGKPANVAVAERDAELIRLRAEVDQLRAGIRNPDGDQTVHNTHDGRRS